MTDEINHHCRKTLVVYTDYPSFAGSGNQIRAAALLTMLVAREDIYLVIIDNSGADFNQSAICELVPLCKKVLHIKVVSDLSVDYRSQLSSIDKKLYTKTLLREQVSEAVNQFYHTYKLELLFLFRMETFLYLQSHIEQYTVKYLDLDELSSRKNQFIHDLKAKNGIAPVNTHINMLLLTSLEKRIIPLFDKVFVSSELEANNLLHLIDSNNVYVLPNIYPFLTQPSRQPVTTPQEIMFVGSFFYYPNEDAVHYFCHDIFPHIRQHLGANIVFNVVGFAPPASFKNIVNEMGVQLMGYQENLADLYSRATLTVVPLRAGTGTRLKILESFAYGCPVVSTAIGASGLKITHDKNILIADEPKLFAKACLSVLESPDLARSLSEKGRNLYQQHYSPEVLLRYYDKIRNDNSICYSQVF